MYQVGELLVYGSHGVCRFLKEDRQVVDRKMVTYLVLEPLGQENARFMVPAHNPVAMSKLRKLPQREELEALLDPPEIRNEAWVTDENRRKQLYRELIGSGDRERLLSMMRAIVRHKEAQAAAGRKCHICDDNFLRDAEKLMIGQIAVVMEMDQEEAKTFLRKKLH